MSSYLNVYYHDQEHNSYISLGSFSRSTETYKIFNDNGYTGTSNKIMPITINDIQNLIGATQTDIDYYKQRISNTKAKTQTILNMQGHTIQEKMEAVGSNEEFLSEYEESINNLNHVQSYLIFLQDVIESNQFAHKGSDGNTVTPDKDRLIYCGIDCDCPIDYRWD